jgi:hypothetical protein
MKTNLLQSQLHRNAALITSLTKILCEHKADAKAAQLSVSRRHHRAIVAKLSAKVNRLAAIQKDIKFDLLAQKLARPAARRKHGKDDPRYTAWADAQMARAAA